VPSLSSFCLMLGQIEQSPDAGVTTSGHEPTCLLVDGMAWHEDLLRPGGSEPVPGCCSPKEGNEMEEIEGSFSRMVLRSVGPSIRRALSSIVSVFSLPLLLLAAISAAKLLQACGLMEPYGWFKIAIEWQTGIVEFIQECLVIVRLSIPAYVFDVVMFYIFIGNAVARAEKDELLAVELVAGTAGEIFIEAVKKRRIELFFYSIPGLIRGFMVGLLWPLAALYRLGTPWVVDGPGPDGEEISTSVPRPALLQFASMVVEAGLWSQQTLYDHRLVLISQIALGISSSVALQALARLL